MKQTVRWLLYGIGMVVLALGLTLNTKTGLGVSPIISTAYCASELLSLNFGDMTLALYGLFIVAQMVIHAFLHRRGQIESLSKAWLTDVLQLPLSLVFTRFLNLFAAGIPDFAATGYDHWLGSIGGRLLILVIAIICTGIGAVLTLDMRLIPNPGDGIVQTLADCFDKEVGLMKNMVDIMSILVTVTVSFLVTGHVIGIGVGTLLAMLGVGRVMAVFNHFFLKTLHKYIL